MLIHDGIGYIELHAVVDKVPMVYRPTVIWDNQDVILIDTGLPGMLEMIKENLEKLAVGKLTKIISTHHDYDHIGSLHEIINHFSHRIEVYANEKTKPYIEGEEKLIKKGFTVPKTNVDHVITDGEVLPFGGGIQVVFTPGHTPDHMSLYHQPTKILISGDALTAKDGRLLPPNKVFTLDMEQALASLNQFLNFEIDAIICYHGGVCREELRERVLEMVYG